MSTIDANVDLRREPQVELICNVMSDVYGNPWVHVAKRHDQRFQLWFEDNLLDFFLERDVGRAHYDLFVEDNNTLLRTYHFATRDIIYRIVFEALRQDATKGFRAPLFETVLMSDRRGSHPVVSFERPEVNADCKVSPFIEEFCKRIGEVFDKSVVSVSSYDADVYIIRFEDNHFYFKLQVSNPPSLQFTLTLMLHDVCINSWVGPAMSLNDMNGVMRHLARELDKGFLVQNDMAKASRLRFENFSIGKDVQDDMTRGSKYEFVADMTGSMFGAGRNGGVDVKMDVHNPGSGAIPLIADKIGHVFNKPTVWVSEISPQKYKMSVPGNGIWFLVEDWESQMNMYVMKYGALQEQEKLAFWSSSKMKAPAALAEYFEARLIDCRDQGFRTEGHKSVVFFSDMEDGSGSSDQASQGGDFFGQLNSAMQSGFADYDERLKATEREIMSSIHPEDGSFYSQVGDLIMRVFNCKNISMEPTRGDEVRYWFNDNQIAFLLGPVEGTNEAVRFSSELRGTELTSLYVEKDEEGLEQLEEHLTDCRDEGFKMTDDPTIQPIRFQEMHYNPIEVEGPVPLVGDDDEQIEPSGKFAGEMNAVAPSIVPQNIGKIRVVALKFDGTVIGFRFKTDVGAFDMSKSVALKYGLGSYKTETFITLGNVNGMFMSSSEQKSHSCVPDVSDCEEDCQRLVSRLFEG